MNTLDLNSALARLLSDGALRDRFAVDAALIANELGMSEANRSAFISLSAADIEFQAQVLIRKRLEAVKSVIPVTCADLRDQLWPHFHNYARTAWLAGENKAQPDAIAFCRFLEEHTSIPIDAGEQFRLNFAASHRRVTLRVTLQLPSRQRPHLPALHIFTRRRCGCIREFALHFGLQPI